MTLIIMRFFTGLGIVGFTVIVLCFTGWHTMRRVDEALRDEAFWSMPPEGWLTAFFAGVVTIALTAGACWMFYLTGALVIKP